MGGQARSGGGARGVEAVAEVAHPVRFSARVAWLCRWVLVMAAALLVSPLLRAHRCLGGERSRRWRFL